MELLNNGTVSSEETAINTNNHNAAGAAAENGLKTQRTNGRNRVENRPDVKGLKPAPQEGVKVAPGTPSDEKAAANGHVNSLAGDAKDALNGNANMGLQVQTGGREAGNTDTLKGEEKTGLIPHQDNGDAGKGDNRSLSAIRAEENLPVAEVKPQLSLETRLRAISDLNRKSIQRLALIGRIQTLEDFEVKLIEEGDELESNPYHGCKLIIQDDKKREFVTNTPGLIRMVSQYIYDACMEKLEEIESSIVFPQA